MNIMQTKQPTPYVPEGEVAITWAEHYLTMERNTLSETLERAVALIERKNKERPVGDPLLPIPTYRYLRTRLSKHSPYDICCARYGKEYAARKYQTVLGYVHADVPLERVEIDHTVIDLMVIDHKTGLPLGRPTLTVGLPASGQAGCGAARRRHPQVAGGAPAPGLAGSAYPVPR
jgi:putative transposase